MRREYDFSKGKRGPVLKTPPGKTRITIRLDNEVLNWFRAQVHAAGGELPVAHQPGPRGTHRGQTRTPRTNAAACVAGGVAIKTQACCK